MAKLYCVSDIHGNFNALQEALNNAGFDPNDEKSWLVVCGDCFDRFDQPVEVMRYLMGLPRKVLVRGNHCDLLVECCERGEAWGHDISNGTAATIWQFGEGHQRSDFADCCITIGCILIGVFFVVSLIKDAKEKRVEECVKTDSPEDK